MRNEITVPNNLSEVTLGQYQNYLAQSEGLEGDELAQVTVSIFCNLDIESVRYVSLNDVREVSAVLNLLFAKEQDLNVEFSMDLDSENTAFGFINDLEGMSFGEYIDLDKYVSDWKEMHRAMAVLYRPILRRQKDKYTIMDYEGTNDFAEIMKQTPLDIVLGALVFFYALEKELLKASLAYLEAEAVELTTTNKHSSMPNMDGLQAYTQSLKATLSDLMRQQVSTLSQL